MHISFALEETPGVEDDFNAGGDGEDREPGHCGTGEKMGSMFFEDAVVGSTYIEILRGGRSLQSSAFPGFSLGTS
jgi:hypothetical protein